MLRSIRDLSRFKIHGVDGDIGHAADFFFDDSEWVVRYLVADTGSWLARNRVLISPMAIRDFDWDNHCVDLSLTREQITHSPDIDTDMPVSRQQEMEYYSYYRWPYYWTGAGLWGTAATLGMYPGGFSNQVPVVEPPQETRAGQETGDPHLRSAKEIRGYHLEAPDGTFGHVEDLILDDRTLAIRYLVVDTRSWRPSKWVLIAPEWISELNWAEQRARVEMPKERIQDAPEYVPDVDITPEYEARLRDHYGFGAMKKTG